MVRSDGAGGYNIGLQRGGKNYAYGALVWDTNSFSIGDTVLIVGDWEFIGAAGNSGGYDDVANLWIDPASSTFGAASDPTPDLTSITTNSTENDMQRAAGFMVMDNPGAPTALIDDLRIGLNWADVTPNDNVVTIVQDPTDLALANGDTATFTVVADGAMPLAYQWIKDGTTLLANSSHISGANSNVLIINNISGADEGSYSVSVTNVYGKTTNSASASLSLADPAIPTQPQSHSANYGTTTTFEVGASGTSPFTYQWHKDGSPLSDSGNISGSHSSMLTVSSVTYLDSGNYSVTVTNALGATADSATAHLTVNDPYFATPPMSASAGLGGTVTFHTVLDGTPGFSYSWFKDGGYLFDDGTNIFGAYTDTLTVTNISSANAGNYYLVVSGGSGNTITSSVVSLTILSPVTITAQPNPRTVAPGSRAAFAVGVAGDGPFTYHWLRNGTNIPGATSQAYSLTSAQTSDQGDYWVIVSGSFNSVTSAPAALVVSNDLHFYETNLVIIRVGDGAETLSVSGNSMALDQFTPNGSYVNTVAIPDDGPTGMVAIGWDNISGVNSGQTTGSSLTRSLDGRFMVIAGYNTNLNYGASLAASFATDVPRGIGLIDSYEQYSMPVADTNDVFSGTYWRAAITDGTNNYWGAGGTPGTYYFGYDSPGAVVQALFHNPRSMGLFNGNIYCAEASDPKGVLKIDGMPTDSTAGTNYLFNTDSTGTYDLTVSPDGNLIYVADQRSIASGGGIQRWDFDGSSWTNTYTLTDGLGDIGPRYITADFSGANPVLYVTSNDNTFDNNRLIRFEDTGAGSVGTTLAYAGANATFRGLHFGPVVNPIAPHPVISFQHQGNNLILTWSGSYTLQSSTNVVGPYSDIVGAMTPYTNNIPATGQMFFRLRN